MTELFAAARAVCIAHMRPSIGELFRACCRLRDAPQAAADSQQLRAAANRILAMMEDGTTESMEAKAIAALRKACNYRRRAQYERRTIRQPRPQPRGKQQ